MSADLASLLGAVTRWAGFVGALLVTGAVVFRYSLLPGYRRAGGAALPGALEGAAAAGVAAALLLAIAAPIRLYAQALGFVEPGEAVTREILATILRETAWGRGWVLQLLGAALAAAGFLAARALPRHGWIMAAGGATAVILAAPLTGHATASDRAGSWGYPLDVIHLLGAGAWLGTLAVLVIAGFPAASGVTDGRDGRAGHDGTGERDLRAGPTGGIPPVTLLVRAFSPIALAGAGTAIGAGVILAFRYLEGSITALWTTSYGLMLFRKLVVLAAILLLGAVNWRVITPRLDQPGGPARIRRSSVLELLLGTVLLVVTALLVSTGMPGE